MNVFSNTMQDNRSQNSCSPVVMAPLIGYLRRWNVVLATHHDSPLEEMNVNGSDFSSPTACLLRQASLSPEPEDGDKDIDVDLYQAALLIMAHLDRLATPFLLPQLSAVSFSMQTK